MNTLKDIEYSREHTKDSLWELYRIWATDDDYYTLCEMIKRRIDCTLVKVEYQSDGIQEVYRVLFKGGVIYAVWHSPSQIIRTVLGDIYGKN